MENKFVYLKFFVGVLLGSVIACSPTKFGKNQVVSTLCENTTGCIVNAESTDITQSFKVGSGKVDILFVNDNSASMSKSQVQMALKFSGFIQNLDSKSIDYRIAITTTDLSFVLQNKLVSFSNGKKFITNQDIERVNLFNNSIVRNETIICEDFIVGMFNTYGATFQIMTEYMNKYSTKCPSPDTRGIYTANVVVSENSSSFMRNDANLNIILISNDNVRQGKPMESNDTAQSFTQMMKNKYPNKFWDFNSIIVKDNNCKDSQVLRNYVNQIVPGIGGGIGIEYANLSNSAAEDIDGNPRPRGQILNICESDYSQHFQSMMTQISQESRMFTMRCTPRTEPLVRLDGNSNGAVSYKWEGDKIIFDRSAEGLSVTISYQCYTGPT